MLVRAGGALVERVRAAAQEGDLDEVLDALSADGVRATPDFVAVLEGSPLRVVTRGSAYAVASGPAGPTELRATGRGPWADQDADPDVTVPRAADRRHRSRPPCRPPPSPQSWSPPPSDRRRCRRRRPVADTQLPPAGEPASGGAAWKLPSVFGRGRVDEPAAASSPLTPR